MEIFKDIKGFEGLYQISNYGRVYSTKRKKPRIINGMNRNDYRVVRLKDKNDVQHNILVHRLVALHFLNIIEDKNVVNHKDFNRSNNHVDNLEWCTQKENMQHAHQNGRIKSYEEFIKKGLEARQKPVIDLLSGITYKSLTIACKTLGIHPNSEWYRIKRNQKEKRFTFA
jgi:hypothetical protein